MAEPAPYRYSVVLNETLEMKFPGRVKEPRRLTAESFSDDDMDEASPDAIATVRLYDPGKSSTMVTGGMRFRYLLNSPPMPDDVVKEGDSPKRLSDSMAFTRSVRFDETATIVNKEEFF